MSQEPSLAARRASPVMEPGPATGMNPGQVQGEETGLRLSQNPSQQVRVSTVNGWGTCMPAVQLRQGTKTSDKTVAANQRTEAPDESSHRLFYSKGSNY